MRNILLTFCTLFIFNLTVYAQEDKTEQKEKIKIQINDDANPDVYIDGKKYDTAIIDLLDSDKIANIEVIKGEKAVEEYDSPNGVVLITTKKNDEPLVEISSDKSKIKIKTNKDKDKDKEPLIIIDGKASSKKELKKLNPNKIETISVIKGEKAMEKYNTSNGVIEVKTKKGK